jgi:hypothetical protein
MDLGSIFLIFAVALLVSVFISRPFFNRSASARLVETGTKSTSEEERLRSALLAERDRVLVTLQELDFDYTLGKVPAEDYPEQRAELLQNGAAVLSKLDQLDKQSPKTSAEDRLEAEVAARRGDGRERPRLPSADQDELEGLIASRRRVRQEKAAGFCPKCGRPLQKSDQFCSSCGAPISQS